MHHHTTIRRLQIDRCFGFETAVEEAQRALLAAKVEAGSACRGLGLVKLMGRQSGFISMMASMASGGRSLHACQLA
jgi:6-phosphofructokinase 1